MSYLIPCSISILWPINNCSTTYFVRLSILNFYFPFSLYFTQLSVFRIFCYNFKHSYATHGHDRPCCYINHFTFTFIPCLYWLTSRLGKKTLNPAPLKLIWQWMPFLKYFGNVFFFHSTEIYLRHNRNSFQAYALLSLILYFK